MTKSTPLQRRALFDGLVKRAREGKRGMSVGAMELAYDFDNAEQLQDALRELAATGHLSIDIAGRFPAIRLLKPKINALHPLAKPLFLSPGRETGQAPTSPALVQQRPLDGSQAVDLPMIGRLSAEAISTLKPVAVRPPQDDIPLHPPRPPLVVREKPAPSVAPKPDVREQFASMVTDTEIQPIVAPPQSPPAWYVPPQATAPAPEPKFRADKRLCPDRDPQITFRVSKDEHEWLLDALDTHPEPLALSAFCKHLFQAEVDRRRNEGSEKHRLSALVMRAAREEGVPLGTFVTRMIEVGMAARDMNRRGI